MDQIRVWGQRAEALGIKAEFVEALKFINNKLALEPLSWGDPQFRPRHLDLLMCHGIHAYFHVQYAVDEGKHIIYFKDLHLIPGSKLD